MTHIRGVCPWCGGTVPTDKRLDARFCTDPCRKAFNANRAKRGAQLYDLFMVNRYEQPLAKQFNVWKLMCRMAAEWYWQDQRERAGRHSWEVPQEVLARHPHLRAEAGPQTKIGRGA